MELIDIGVNLTSDAFAGDRDAAIQRAQEAGVGRLIVTGTSAAESLHALEIAGTSPGVLFSTAGIHPHGAHACTPEALAELRAVAADPHVVAIGETGLDFNRDFSPRPAQERAFALQLELAAELGLPVFIHQRDAHDRLLAILSEQRDRLVDAVVHCFTDERAALFDYLDLDLHIGVTGWICDERRGRTLREIVREIPEERLMLETDAPWLLPRDLRPRPARGRNEPAFLPHVARAVAQHRATSADALGAATTATAERFFRLPPAAAAGGAPGR